MKKWNGKFESFVKSKGWEKISGYALDRDEVDGDGDILYFRIIADCDFIRKATYWQHPKEEFCYEDIDTLMEQYYEDHFDNNDELWDEPVQEDAK